MNIGLRTKSKGASILMLLSFALLASCASEEQATNDAADYQRQSGAGADETGRVAVAAATEWLRLVDELEYRKSWSEASALLRAEVSQADWVNNLSNMRGPLGALKQRVATSSEFHESLDGVPDGNYVLFTYDSSFESRESSTEIVALAQEANSSWRVIGYYFP